MVGGQTFKVLGRKISVYKDPQTKEAITHYNVYIAVHLDDYNKDVDGDEVGVCDCTKDLYDYILSQKLGCTLKGVVTRKKGSIMQIGCIFD